MQLLSAAGRFDIVSPALLHLRGAGGTTKSTATSVAADALKTF